MTDPATETLGQKQHRFVAMVAKLIEYALAIPGAQLAFGEAWRTPEQAQWDAAHGTGIVHSVHIDRLAIDLLLFLNGAWQKDSAAYEPLGVFWESLAPDACWGGRFSKPDGNHFSIEHNGFK